MNKKSNGRHTYKFRANLSYESFFNYEEKYFIVFSFDLPLALFSFIYIPPYGSYSVLFKSYLCYSLCYGMLVDIQTNLNLRNLKQRLDIPMSNEELCDRSSHKHCNNLLFASYLSPIIMHLLYRQLTTVKKHDLTSCFLNKLMWAGGIF